jgi:mono/diheme cytochrome c family protein
MPYFRCGIRSERNGAKAAKVTDFRRATQSFYNIFSGGNMNREMKLMGTGILGLLLCMAFGVFALPAQGQGGGEALYKSKCAGCHGPDGKGQTAVGKADNIRDLGSAEVQGQSDDAIAGIIGNGKGKMPAYGKSLKPDQIKDLVAYIRTLKK